ncbi:hypothetical protein GMLC_29920 [Geomonas limicola]|uniref:CheW-like domain-containing protein n=1 Tax=Geomonas limicola TaxID=2740186 RepID=A0A6V8ND04_9BACT|nr:chemotaxis protein CheW [Geomonas limicola]GFO69413.1 hypothetical protein GMLC_29920 [Geomonas limicola]
MEERLLLFTVRGEGYAFELQEVAEVMEPSESYPIPKAPVHFVGLINFHGALTALVDLGLYLGKGRQARSQGKFLVLDPRLAGLALWVDGVESVVPASTILARSAGDGALCTERLETAQGNYRLVKVETLLQALEQGLAGAA